MRVFSWCGKRWLIALVGLVILGGVAWLNRTPLLTWYGLRGLAAASEQDRESWAEWVAGLDEAALPGLLDLLARDDPQTCANAEAALSQLTRRWGQANERTARLTGLLGERFGQFSKPGQHAVLELAIVVLRPEEARSPAPAAVVEAGFRLLTAAASGTDKGVKLRTLALAEVLIDRATPQAIGFYRDLARKGLAETDADCRVRAVHLALHAALKQDADVLRRVVPLLRDGNVGVRRAALLAVGLAEQVIPEDDLLPLLHDADAEVRRLCEGALRGRGRQEKDIRLARLISHPEADGRLQLLRHLHQAEYPGVWLRRLSQDPDAAVRAAAVRAAAEHPQVDLADRLREMRDNDPSATVRQLAAYYLQRRPPSPR
jgi:HEAT repeat protein